MQWRKENWGSESRVKSLKICLRVSKVHPRLRRSERSKKLRRKSRHKIVVLWRGVRKKRKLTMVKKKRQWPMLRKWFNSSWTCLTGLSVWSRKRGRILKLRFKRKRSPFLISWTRTAAVPTKVLHQAKNRLYLLLPRKMPSATNHQSLPLKSNNSLSLVTKQCSSWPNSAKKAPAKKTPKANSKTCSTQLRNCTMTWRSNTKNSLKVAASKNLSSLSSTNTCSNHSQISTPHSAS